MKYVILNLLSLGLLMTWSFSAMAEEKKKETGGEEKEYVTVKFVSPASIEKERNNPKNIDVDLLIGVDPKNVVAPGHPPDHVKRLRDNIAKGQTVSIEALITEGNAADSRFGTHDSGLPQTSGNIPKPDPGE